MQQDKKSIDFQANLDNTSLPKDNNIESRQSNLDNYTLSQDNKADNNPTDLTSNDQKIEAINDKQPTPQENQASNNDDQKAKTDNTSIQKLNSNNTTSQNNQLDNIDSSRHYINNLDLDYSDKSIDFDDDATQQSNLAQISSDQNTTAKPTKQNILDNTEKDNQAELSSKQNVATQDNANFDRDKVNSQNQSNSKKTFFELPLEQKIKLEQTNNFEINDYNKKKEQYLDKRAQSFTKILADYIFLLGRVTTQAITDFDRNIIIPQNTLITAEVVLKAFSHGRLLELTKYSKS